MPLAWRLADELRARVETVRLPEHLHAFSYLDGDRDVILLGRHLDPLPMRQAEALLHELGHRHSPTMLGRVGDCSPWQIGQALSRSEAWAQRWAASHAIPMADLTRRAGDLRDSFDVADAYGCSHAYARHVVALYCRLFAENERIAPWELVRLFRRASREAG